MNSNVIDFAPSKLSKMWFLNVEQSIVIKYYCQIAKANAIYVFIDVPAGKPTEDPPNSDV
jgi:hypothetical protein